MNEADEAPAPEFAFCGACGFRLSASARFCRSCGCDQDQFSESEPGTAPDPQPDVEPEETVETLLRPDTGPPSTRSGLLSALAERHGLLTSPAPEGNQSFRPTGAGVAGELSGLPARIDEGDRPDGSTRLVRVRFGVIDGDPQDAAKALSGAPAWSVSSNRIGVEVVATADQLGGGTDAAVAYVEDLARRCAASIELQGSSRPDDSARILSVAGYPTWVATADTADIEGLELRHLELDERQAVWEEMAVRLVPTPDGALAAIPSWEGETTLISLMGRIALARQTEDGSETRLVLGSGVCTFTNRRLVAVAYERPDDDMLEGLVQGLRESGITFEGEGKKPINPFLSYSEAEKALFFVNGAGAVEEEGGGTILALSAFPQLFARADSEGGMMQRGLGIPTVLLTGSKVNLTIQPFRLLDRELRTVKPRRGEVKEAVNAWWGMAASGN